MIEQIHTVAWKEWKALADQAGIGRVGGMVVLTVVVGIMGVFMPWLAGPDYMDSPINLFLYPFVGIASAANPVIDSFAGERERRTLETLLAGPLDDRAILLGKMWVGFATGVGVPMLLAGMAVVTVNVKVWGTGIVWPPLWAALGVPLITVGGAGLVCTAGVLASMRCATVRQAGQVFGYTVMGTFLIPVIVVTALPDSFKLSITTWIAARDPLTLVLILVGALWVLDAVCLVLAFQSFRRGEMAVE